MSTLLNGYSKDLNELVCREYTFFHIIFFRLLNTFSPLTVFSRVLNEFILKNPNLESKKDQRELQVIILATFTPIQLSITFIVFISR